jgi:hypothetical protein
LALSAVQAVFGGCVRRLFFANGIGASFGHRISPVLDDALIQPTLSNDVGANGFRILVLCGLAVPA